MPLLLSQMGDRIRLRREKLGLTQRDVASALQVTNQAVSKWERGENGPDIEALAGLARVLGVSVDYLLGTHGHEGEVFDATIFMSDVKGFAKRLSAMPERDGATWLNGLLFQMTEAAVRYDAVPVKYMGDSLLAFFAGADHRDRAVRAALLAKQVMGEALSIGLHSGPIFLTRIGHPDFAQRDVIGPTMVVAVRTFEWARQQPSGLGASSTVVDGLVSDDLKPSIGPAQTVQLKSVDGPSLMHEILST
jgi:class 3 adenylate cyclase